MCGISKTTTKSPKFDAVLKANSTPFCPKGRWQNYSRTTSYIISYNRKNQNLLGTTLLSLFTTKVLSDHEY